jgi:transposase
LIPLLQERADAMKKYVVTLTAKERSFLESLIATGKTAARKQRQARILLKADAGAQGPAWSDQAIAEAVEVGLITVARARRRFVEEGLEAALSRKAQTRRFIKVDGDVEARLVTLACSKPPQGRARWTLQLLADGLVALKVVDCICLETVRQTLKKTGSSPG